MAQAAGEGEGHDGFRARGVKCRKVAREVWGVFGRYRDNELVSRRSFQLLELGYLGA